MRRTLCVLFIVVVVGGCSKPKGESHFFQGELVQTGSGGEETRIPVLLQREFREEEKQVVITNHQKTGGRTHHFVTVYDFKAGTVEMTENGNVLSSGTFACDRSGETLNTLTSCTYDLKTSAGDEIHGTDNYNGQQSVSFSSTLAVKKSGAQFTFGGGAESVNEEEFRSLLSSRFPSGGGSGCQVGRSSPTSPAWGFAAGMILVLASLRSRAGRRNSHARST